MAPALAAFAPVVGLAGAQGGYFPSAWGWATFPLLWVAALALALRERIRLSWSERAFTGLLVALTLWILLSATWSVASAPSILESERGLLYVAGVAAVLLVTRSRDVPQLLGGLVAGICAIAVFSLATRLFPDRVGVYDGTSVYRLAQPIGYWNGLAIFTGMGALVALAFACRSRSLPVRAASAVAPVLLLPTFYFTFGRGAWIALAAGAVFAVLIDPRRLQLLAGLLALLPLSAVGVWAASREPGLTHAGAPLSQAVHDGHRLALVLILLALGNAAVAVAFSLAERRIEPSAPLRRGLCPLRRAGHARAEGLPSLQGPAAARPGEPEQAAAELLRERTGRSVAPGLGRRSRTLCARGRRRNVRAVLPRPPAPTDRAGA